MKKILFYTNQFFGQIGGEDMAYAEPQLFEGMHGSGSYHFGPTVMTVLSHLRYHDTRLATFLFSEFFAQFRCPNEIGILFSL